MGRRADLGVLDPASNSAADGIPEPIPPDATSNTPHPDDARAGDNHLRRKPGNNSSAQFNSETAELAAPYEDVDGMSECCSHETVGGCFLPEGVRRGPVW